MHVSDFLFGFMRLQELHEMCILWMEDLGDALCWLAISWSLELLEVCWFHRQSLNLQISLQLQCYLCGWWFSGTSLNDSGWMPLTLVCWYPSLSNGVLSGGKAGIQDANLGMRISVAGLLFHTDISCIWSATTFIWVIFQEDLRGAWWREGGSLWGASLCGIKNCYAEGLQSWSLNRFLLLSFQSTNTLPQLFLLEGHKLPVGCPALQVLAGWLMELPALLSLPLPSHPPTHKKLQQVGFSSR